MSKESKYYLGLDIGTNSVGWAVTDESYKLMRAKGKDLWGVRMFDEAKTASERRLNRSARRRQQRRKSRLQILKELLEPAINKIDPNFFTRLEESQFYLEDKSIDQKYVLFGDEEYTDKDYHNNYPTIYHLRKNLINSEEKHDIRLVYLAIHHIMKNRGHFLIPGDSISNITTLAPALDSLINHLRLEYEIDITYQDINEIDEIILDQKIGKTEKNKRLSRLLSLESKELKALFSLIAGSKVSVSKMFPELGIEKENDKSISFESDDYEEVRPELEILLRDRIELIDRVKAVFDYKVLENILKGEEYISYGKVNTYDSHKKDLKTLKRVFRKYFTKDDYKNFFSYRSTKDQETSYSAYVGHTNVNGRRINVRQKVSREELQKDVAKRIMKLDQTDQDIHYLTHRIETDNLFRNQVTRENAVIPHQVHYQELKIILEKASRHHEIFGEETDGYTVKEKIEKLFLFRIPYYVGPLNDAHKVDGGLSGYCWVVKNSDDIIRPWNFEKIVNIDRTAEMFIRRMTNTCTYLSEEEVIPKASLMYSKYMVLNELNNLRIDGEKPPVELKKEIYHNLFCEKKKVSQSSLEKWLRNNGHISGDVILSGFDGDFKSSLGSLIDFDQAGLMRKLKESDIEQIILWKTLYGDEWSIIKRQIKKHYPKLTKSDINRIRSFKYRDWGRFSKKFLTELYTINKETGEMTNIITELYETNNNLMELLSDKFDFNKEIEKANQGKGIVNMDYDSLDGYRISPSVKRMIWQTLLVVTELKKVLKSDPEKIFIEMARGSDGSGRKFSRRNQLIDLYKSCKDEEREWVKELEARDDQAFRQDRLFFYYTQKGKCLYCGENIDIANLQNRNIYDIDHIFPQSVTKDDSIDNRVLVHKNCNNLKSDRYPIDINIISKQSVFWKHLKDCKLITDRKYNRLTRMTSFTEDELVGFINRQLVETRQTTKIAANILENVFSKSTIVYVKAGLISDFRRDFKIPKCREVNDFHHSHDAYLNIVVGNAYDTKFTSNYRKFIRSKQKYNMRRLFDFPIEGRNGFVWDPNITISLIKKTLNRNSCLITQQAVYGSGQLFNLSHVPKDDIRHGTDYLPLKKKGPLSAKEKYGAYKNIGGAYFFAVEHTHKKQRIRTIEQLPLHLLHDVETGNLSIEDYCKNSLLLIEPLIVARRILFQSLVRLNGYHFYLTGKTGKRLSIRNAEQLYANLDITGKFQHATSFADKYIKSGRKLEVHSGDNIDHETLDSLYDYLLNKHTYGVYQRRPNPQMKSLNKSLEQYNKLSIGDKCEVIQQVLVLSQRTVAAANLTSIGLSRNTGKALINKNYTSANECKIIHQSPTGLFQTSVDLLK